MLNVGKLDDVSGILEKFESRVAEAERQRMEATEGAKRYSAELEKEKERLVKLWDAYKNQEEELSSVEKKINEYEERAKIAEASKKQLEDDYTARINTLSQKLDEYQDKANNFEDYKRRYEEFDQIRHNMEQQIHTLEEENINKTNNLNVLNEEINKLKNLENYAQYKEKYEEVCTEYEKEKERLTKLYHLYEETDNECKRLKEETNSWKEWYNSNKEIFDKLFSTAPPVATTEWSSDETSPAPPERPIEDPTRPRAKKKLSFKK